MGARDGTDPTPLLIFETGEKSRKMLKYNNVWQKKVRTTGKWYAPQKLDTFGGAYFYGKKGENKKDTRRNSTLVL